MKRRVIALTGQIGSGKSQIARILRDMGYKTVDCDAIAREVSDDPTVVERVSRLLGEQYVADGKLNRKLIRERVFADGELLEKYQNIFFGKIRERLLQIVSQATEPLFVEIPVFDAFDFDWEEIWLVRCDRDRSIQRVQARDNVSADSVRSVLSRQKYPAPTRVIQNDGTLSQLEQAVRKTLRASSLQRD